MFIWENIGNFDDALHANNKTKQRTKLSLLVGGTLEQISKTIFEILEA